ncbi:MAG: YggS family pyridoxal phosphate-dependent enzyme [Bacteroidales bacterium]|uniref:YggS family pyridoxal phosphate-dependent enzyme n=1 Tax=Porphyromonas sp. TaxID=1924944 RepID=UPI0029777B47|nr:YggS family pyridoxal phosphate-dependent enzyme [Porphyromonas sp.]MDD7437994.1 YggS family pyridoxal phosphate-dependent enzyme [Bacteroidales bacterium]MDY3067434.1 YggS family pyridoxal phosphate-dependent enzyme [Porphyromonas sp.]
MSIRERLETIRRQLPKTTKLIAVSKYHTPEEVMEAYDAGHRLFGENRVQELLPKREALPKDIEWHLIGTLQRNKVKYVVPFVSMIHSIDSVKLLKEVEKECSKQGRKELPVLLQIHISREETKHGFSPEEVKKFLTTELLSELQYTKISGIMGMASLTDDMDKVENEFAEMQELFDELRNGVFKNSPSFSELSMGMTHDYPIAVKHGATIIRVGSAIFS